MFSMKEFGQRVSNLRKVRNLTQDELAYRVNVNKGHISRIERGTVACSLELLIDSPPGAPFSQLLFCITVFLNVF